jgi:quinolinate phosphoribosyl transferase-like protein
MPLAPLPAILIEPIVREALLEDLGRAGDLTTDAIVPRDLKTKTVMAARQAGVVAGLDLAALAFRLIDPAIRFEPLVVDGATVKPGARVAVVEGPARGCSRPSASRSISSAERAASRARPPSSAPRSATLGHRLINRNHIRVAASLTRAR